MHTVSGKYSQRVFFHYYLTFTKALALASRGLNDQGRNQWEEDCIDNVCTNTVKRSI